MVNKYNYKTKDGLININTLSPNGKYFYRVSKIKSLNLALWGIKLAFFNISGKLIYYKKTPFYIELNDYLVNYEFINELNYNLPKHNTSSLQFVKWSKNGNIDYFIKHNQEINTECFLDLENEKLYLNYDINKTSFIPHYFTDEFYKKTYLNFKKNVIHNDIFSENIFFNKWYPSLKD